MKIRSIFRYPGGKSKVALLLLKYMPRDTAEYRELMVGGGGVYFTLNPSLIRRRWINDLNQPLIDVYNAFLLRPADFIAKCREIDPQQPGETEIATKGTGKKYNKRLGEIFKRFRYDTEMDQALRYFFINRTVWGGRVNYDPAFDSRLYYSNPSGWNIVKRNNFLEDVAKHVSGTKITCGDYSEGLRVSGERVWIYVDPPYIINTKLYNGSKLYQFGFTMDEHLRFVEECRTTKHRIAISYDDVPEVRDWFRKEDGFWIYEHTWMYYGTSQDKKTVGKELVITNYERDERMFGTVEPHHSAPLKTLIDFT